MRRLPRDVEWFGVFKGRSSFRQRDETVGLSTVQGVVNIHAVSLAAYLNQRVRIDGVREGLLHAQGNDLRRWYRTGGHRAVEDGTLMERKKISHP